MVTAIRRLDKALNGRLRVLWGFCVKELQELFRFKLEILKFAFAPLLTMMSFFMVYSAIFLSSDTTDLGYVQKSNYVLYLLTGFLAYSCFHVTWGKTNLRYEKIMLTLEGMLLSPRSRLYMMMGKGIKALLEISIIILIFTVLLFLMRPEVNWTMLGYGIIALVLVFIIFISFDFIVSAIGLSEEGLSGILVNYLPRAFLILSAVYFSIEAIPEYLRFLVYINPVYIAVNIFRSAFMDADIHFGLLGSLLYLLLLSITVPYFAAKIFDFILKKWGIRGY
ncbi:ABC transporter permease [Patescibacteria group bacterium]|nr:ABC transporter permease [Patescibacteria group bacterium]